MTTMEMREQEYRIIPVTQLRPHPDNPNQGDEQALADSIDENGFFGACTVWPHPDEEGAFQILGGEHRWREACRRGQLELPCIVQLDIDHVTAVRILLADNEVGKRGTNRQDALDRCLETLGSLKGTGLDDILDRASDAVDEKAAEEAEEAASSASEDADGSEGPYGSDEDPDADFTREYGILVMAESEVQQQQVYEELARQYGASMLRVVSV